MSGIAKGFHCQLTDILNDFLNKIDFKQNVNTIDTMSDTITYP